MNPAGGPSERLRRLVADPGGCHRADCEAYGEMERLSWAAGIQRAMLGSQNGLQWFQNFLLSMAAPSNAEWEGVVVRISQLPRASAPTPAEDRAGRLRFAAGGLRTVREGLKADPSDPHGAAYAWVLWRASAFTGLRLADIRRAQVAGTRLENDSGDILLKRMTPQAAKICAQLQTLRAQAAGTRGEAALFAAAERAWDRASATLPDESRPLLASARHLSIAVWRNELDDMMLAVLLGEEESDVARWGLSLLPGSEIETHRPPRPLRRAEARGAGRAA